MRCQREILSKHKKWKTKKTQSTTKQVNSVTKQHFFCREWNNFIIRRQIITKIKKSRGGIDTYKSMNLLSISFFIWTLNEKLLSLSSQWVLCVSNNDQGLQSMSNSKKTKKQMIIGRAWACVLWVSGSLTWTNNLLFP